jgi:diacylglycerol kinase family enzyme
MNYYIFDIKKCKKRSQVESIKEHLGTLGISGEFTYPSAAQSIEELVQLGLSKQYTTIVAIGGDEIANSVAGALVGRKEAMGFIPLEISPDLAQMIGTDNWKSACEVLRFRKIKETRIGKTTTGKHFLTSAQLDIKNTADITLELKDFIIQAKVKSLVVSNFNPEIKKIGDDFLDITMTSVEPYGSVLSKFSSLFGGSNKEEGSFSLLHARSMRIFTKSQMSIIAGNESIAKTPQLIESTDDFLRLIVAKNALDL